MCISTLDHIVICVRDMEPFVAFYRDHLDAQVVEGRAEKFDLHFGNCKLSLQSPDALPDFARNTKPGTANFCLVSDEDVTAIYGRLNAAGIEPVSELKERDGATGPIRSFHFHDPEGNLVELCNRL